MLSTGISANFTELYKFNLPQPGHHYLQGDSQNEWTLDKEIIGWCISCYLVFVSIPENEGEKNIQLSLPTNFATNFNHFLKCFGVNKLLS